MRSIKRKALEAFWSQHRHAMNPLIEWYDKTRHANWTSFADVRATFGQTDQALVDSNNKVYVFNIGGNKYRLIAAIHYNTGIVYVLRVLTRAQYDLDKWKREL